MPANVVNKLKPVHTILENKYGFDQFNEKVFASGARNIGSFLSQVADSRIIDGLLVNGTANTIGRLSAVVRRIQSGYVYHYAFAMIIGLVGLMSWMLFR